MGECVSGRRVFKRSVATCSHHSEGESLRKGEKKRLGRRSSPQNGRFGGRATSCEGTEEHTIDQACILGRPAQFTSWARSLWNLMRAVRSPQLTRHALWADPIGGPPKGKMLNFFRLKSTSRPKYQSVQLSEVLATIGRRGRV